MKANDMEEKKGVKIIGWSSVFFVIYRRFFVFEETVLNNFDLFRGDGLAVWKKSAEIFNNKQHKNLLIRNMLFEAVSNKLQIFNDVYILHFSIFL